MASINDYFNIDRKHNITVHSESSLSSSDGTVLPIRMFQNLAAGASYFAVRIPGMSNPLDYCLKLLAGNLVDSVMNAFPKVVISSSSPRFLLTHPLIS